MHRFFVAPGSLDPSGTELSLPGPLAHQVSHVLRLRPGDQIVLLDNSGDESEIELLAFGKSEITCRVLARRPAPAEAGPRVTLYQCLLKGEKFGWVLQKATELGVAAVVPVVSERTVARGDAKPERWERIIREAAEQSDRARLPALYAPMHWSAAVAQAGASADLGLVAWEEADPTIPFAPLLARARAAPSVSLFIGPEGGLTDGEIALAEAAGTAIFSLGRRAVRAETAAIAALALLLIPT